MSSYNAYYRRRYFDGRCSIRHSWGEAHVWRDDADLWVGDIAWPEPKQIGALPGRGPDGIAGVVQPQSADCGYGRIWMWRSRPLNMLAMYAADATLAAFRIDFATPLYEHGGALYQTDLYLDMFIAADGRKFVIADEDELEQAYRQGLISHDQLRLVRAQRNELIEVLRKGQFFTWLGQQPPFDPARIPGATQSQSFWHTADTARLWPEE